MEKVRKRRNGALMHGRQERGKVGENSQSEEGLQEEREWLEMNQK